MLTGYGQDIYDDDISLENLSAEMGLQVSEEERDSFKFELRPIGR